MELKVGPSQRSMQFSESSKEEYQERFTALLTRAVSGEYVY
jgi:hypothetical protein